jgi:hypothetical protein
MRYVLPILALMAGTAAADEVHLRNGRKLTNCIAKQEGGKVTVESGLGTVVLEAGEVEAIREGDCPLKEYPAKRAAIESSRKASDWYELAGWCKENGIHRHRGGLLQKVIELEPNHELARRELGFSLHNGKWMTKDEVNRERGLVQFEGKWMSPIDVELVKKKRLVELERKLIAEEERVRKAREAAEARAAAQAAWAEQIEEMRRAQEFQKWVKKYGRRGGYGPMQPWSPWAVDTFDVVGFLQSKGFLPK